MTDGKVLFDGKDLLDTAPEERAREGLFLASNIPVEIPGVTTTYFLKAAVNADPQAQGPAGTGRHAISSKLVKEKMKLLELDDELLNRAVNEGFSGGEKKRNEIFQMAVLEPALAHAGRNRLRPGHRRAARIVAEASTSSERPDNAQLLVTHYQRLLNYIVPDRVHVLVDGRIVKIRRQGTGAGAGGEGLRLGHQGRARGGLTHVKLAAAANRRLGCAPMRLLDRHLLRERLSGWPGASFASCSSGW